MIFYGMKDEEKFFTFIFGKTKYAENILNLCLRNIKDTHSDDLNEYVYMTVRL